MAQDNLLEVGWAGGQALFKAFALAANGHPAQDAIGAAANIIANAVRQNCGTRKEAEGVMHEMFGRTMVALMEHYDPTTGRRRSVVPFDQVLTVSHTKFETKFGRLGQNGRT